MPKGTDEMPAMRMPSTFWSAFWAGLAAPAALYAPIPPYTACVGKYSVPQNFAMVGVRLGQALGSYYTARDQDASV